MKTKSKAATGRMRALLPTGEKGRKRTASKSKSKKHKGRKRGTSNKRFGLKVIEATQDVAIKLLQVDVEKAEALKPTNVNSEMTFLTCVIAQAVTRACGAGQVWIGRRTAYIAYPGEEVCRRYRVNEHSRAVLEAWDEGREVKEGVELILKAPAKCDTRASIRARHNRRRSEGKSTSGKPHRKTDRKQRPSDPLENRVRNGNLVRWS